MSSAIIGTVDEDFAPSPPWANKFLRNLPFDVALIDLRDFGVRSQYIELVGFRENAGAQSREALARGQWLCEIDRDMLADAIQQIELSKGLHRPSGVEVCDREKDMHALNLGARRYFGLFDREIRMVAYCEIGVFANFGAVEKLVGYKNSYGARWKLLMEIIGTLIDEQQLDFFIYRTVGSETPILQFLKESVGFKSYRARYAIERAVNGFVGNCMAMP